MAKEKENKVKNENKRFMKDVKAELKKVTWPTSKQMVSNVTAVITIVLVTAVIVFCLDFVFGAINEYGVDKIKEQVQSKNQTQTQNVEPTTDNEQSGEAEQTEETENTENTENTESTDNNVNAEDTQNN